MQELKKLGLTEEDFDILQANLAFEEKALRKDPIGNMTDRFTQLFGREAVEELKVARAQQLKETRARAEQIVLLKGKLIQLKRLIQNIPAEEKSAK